VKRFPDLTFVLCHIGLADKEDTIALARQCDNIILETSGQPVQGIREAAAAIGADRIIFGSDWPLYHPAVPISCVLEAFPKAADREKVFRDNFLAVIRGKKPGKTRKKASAVKKKKAGKKIIIQEKGLLLWQNLKDWMLEQ